MLTPRFIIFHTLNLKLTKCVVWSSLRKTLIVKITYIYSKTVAKRVLGALMSQYSSVCAKRNLCNIASVVLPGPSGGGGGDDDGGEWVSRNKAGRASNNVYKWLSSFSRASTSCRLKNESHQVAKKSSSTSSYRRTARSVSVSHFCVCVCIIPHLTAQHWNLKLNVFYQSNFFDCLINRQEI